MASEYKVESGVPIPRPSYGPGLTPTYPWREMDIGDSFLVTPREGEDIEACANRVRSAAARWLSRNRPGVRHVTRTVDGGIRVWFVSRDEEG